MADLSEKQVQALKLVESTRGMNLCHRANVIVSQQQRRLLSAGLIDYASGAQAWKITAAGERALAQYCHVAGCFKARDGHSH